MSRDPYDLISQRAAECVESHIEYMRASAKGDTPIEKLFFVALRAIVQYGGVAIASFDYAEDEQSLERLKASGEWPEDSIILQTQVQFEGWRVDFLLHSMAKDGHWRCLIVECDGHDFHERTKEQAAKDRARDRAFHLKNIPVFRFTGSELWRDPWRCAQQVCDWVVKVRWGQL